MRYVKTLTKRDTQFLKNLFSWYIHHGNQFASIPITWDASYQTMVRLNGTKNNYQYSNNLKALRKLSKYQLITGYYYNMDLARVKLTHLGVKAVKTFLEPKVKSFRFPISFGKRHQFISHFRHKRLIALSDLRNFLKANHTQPLSDSSLKKYYTLAPNLRKILSKLYYEASPVAFDISYGFLNYKRCFSALDNCDLTKSTNYNNQKISSKITKLGRILEYKYIDPTYQKYQFVPEQTILKFFKKYHKANISKDDIHELLQIEHPNLPNSPV